MRRFIPLPPTESEARCASLLQEQKDAAVEIGLSRVAKDTDGTKLALIEVAITRDKGRGDELYRTGFVHLTMEGARRVRMPWSPAVG